MLREVTAALDSHLATMSGLPPVAWPNVQFTAPSGLYIAVMNQPADGVMYSLQRQQNTPGTYKINIYGNMNVGPAEAENMADKIAEHFRETSVLIDGLYIEEIKFSPGVNTEDRYLLPMNVDWRYHHGGNYLEPVKNVF